MITETTEYVMQPNTTIYKNDTLWVTKSGIRPARQSDKNQLFTDIKMNDIGKGNDQYKIAAEYKVSGNKPTTIKTYTNPTLTFQIQTDEPEKLRLGKIEKPHKDTVKLKFTEQT